MSGFLTAKASVASLGVNGTHTRRRKQVRSVSGGNGNAAPGTI